MTVYYPGYTYLFASARDNHFSPYCCRLTKNYIRAVVQDLQDLAHHIYVFLENLPENRFAIVRYHDQVRSKFGFRKAIENDSFTLRQFLLHFELFHELDAFSVRFYTEVFYYEQSFTPHTLEVLYRHYLKHLCERGLRENNPVSLTPMLIRQYGLTKADSKKVRQLILEYNMNALEDIQLEYSTLANLDCLKK